MSANQVTVAAALVISTAYFFRRYVIHVQSPPSKLGSREELAKLVENGNSALKITLLDETKQAFADDQTLNSRAFASYLMCEWWLQGAKISHATLLRVMDFMGLCVRSICLHSGGFALCARNSEGIMVASTRVCYVSPQQQTQNDDFATLLGMFNGEIGLPWFALRFNPTLFYKRMMRSIKAMEEARLEVTREFKEHLYLIHLATDPAMQSTGAGTQLLQAIGRIADAHQLPVYLETDSPRLRNYYERNGFKLQCEYEVFDEAGPFTPNFGMLRLPQ